MDPRCWKCRRDPMPTEGMERLALCDDHIRERVREVMCRPADAPKRLRVAK